ncbi:MAG: DUF262 domain-containing protein, partial [Alcaligenaceae bacterium]|nr:DUF262 domain-containing protein [Alcaligenaceae bacterium]
MSSPSCELAPSGPAPVSDQPRLPGSLAKGVKTVAEFLADPDLCIPDYQRPYKWTARHINQLFADINRHKDKNAYRLGTIVFHREGKKRNIVDGQQRTISLVLAIHALVETRINGPQETRIQNPELAACLENLANRMLNPGFNNRLSQSNIRNNYQAIRRIVSRPEVTEDSIAFLLHRCEIVWFELQDISEAFQFFEN